MKGTLPRTLFWKLEGKGLRPSRFPVEGTLAAVHAYLGLLRAVADDLNASLHFTGLKIGKGSVAFKIDVDDEVAALNVARCTDDYLTGRRVPQKRQLASSINEVHRRMGDLPAEYTARVVIGDFSAPIARPPFKVSGELSPEHTEMRVRVLRVGGRTPRVMVEDELEGTFRLKISAEQAQEIARSLYRQVDITAEVLRDRADKIREGILLDYAEVVPVDGDREAAAWREWFAEVGAGWSDVEDIEEELLRLRGTE